MVETKASTNCILCHAKKDLNAWCINLQDSLRSKLNLQCVCYTSTTCKVLMCNWQLKRLEGELIKIKSIISFTRQEKLKMLPSSALMLHSSSRKKKSICYSELVSSCYNPSFLLLRMFSRNMENKFFLSFLGQPFTSLYTAFFLFHLSLKFNSSFC